MNTYQKSFALLAWSAGTVLGAGNIDEVLVHKLESTSVLGNTKEAMVALLGKPDREECTSVLAVSNCLLTWGQMSFRDRPSCIYLRFAANRLYSASIKKGVGGLIKADCP